MLLYHNKIEYSRVVEVVEVTEDGMFALDQVPDDYGGAVLQVEIVHQLTLTDASGYVEILKMDNPVPLNKSKQPSTAAITLDGKDFRPGSSPARTWATKAAPTLSAQIKAKADITLGIMRNDGDFGTPI